MIVTLESVFPGDVNVNSSCNQTLINKILDLGNRSQLGQSVKLALFLSFVYLLQSSAKNNNFGTLFKTSILGCHN